MGRQRQGVEVRPGSIRVNFTWQGRHYKVTVVTNGRPLPPTPANVSYAETLVARVREAIRLGTFRWSDFFPKGGDSGTGLTLRGHFDVWLASLRIATSTRRGYASAVRFWCGAVVKGESLPLGDLPLKALRPSHFRLALATRPRLSGKTVNNYLGVLHEALGSAVDDDMLGKSPVDKVKRAKIRQAAVDPFKPAERDAIIAWMAKRAPPQVANMVDFWFWSGLRTSELFGLRWASVDLWEGAVLVHESLVQGEDKDTTKTGAERLVRLNAHSRAALERQRGLTQMAGEHVFLDPDSGKPWADSRHFLRRHWLRCLKALGIRYRRPYCCRHTYATAMLMAPGGMMNPAFCAKQLGHSVKLFLETYSKWIEGQQDDAEMARLDAFDATQEKQG